MGGIVDKAVSVFDDATLGVTGIGALGGAGTSHAGDFIRDTGNSMFGEPVAAAGGVRPFMQESNLGATALNPLTGEIKGELSPELQALFQQGVSQAGAFGAQVPQAGAQARDLSAGFLSQAGAFDPYAAAEEQFGRLDAILEPGRQRQREGTAGGLLTTGRLGSSAGNLAQAQVEAEIEAQRQGLLSSQFTAAQDVQDRMVSRGTNLGAFGLQQQVGAQGLSQNALAGALGIDAALASQLALGGQLTRDQPIQAEQGGFDAILQGGLTAGLGTLIGSI